MTRFPPLNNYPHKRSFKKLLHLHRKAWMEQRTDVAGWVYVFWEAKDDLFKVGRASNIQRRMKEWAHSCPLERVWLMAFWTPCAKFTGELS